MEGVRSPPIHPHTAALSEPCSQLLVSDYIVWSPAMQLIYWTGSACLTTSGCINRRSMCCRMIKELLIDLKMTTSATWESGEWVLTAAVILDVPVCWRHITLPVSSDRGGTEQWTVTRCDDLLEERSSGDWMLKRTFILHLSPYV